MASDAPMPRSRGGLSGLFLVLLGAWGGLAPFAAPIAGYGFAPDRAWALTSDRIYLSAVPGAVVLLTGLVILVTRSRALGVLCAVAAALGGAWFVAGAALVRVLPARLGLAITTGAPIGTTADRIALTGLAFYGGTGVLIVFFAALALGRFSLAAHRDHLRYGMDTVGLAGPGPGGTGAPAFDAFQPTGDPLAYAPTQAQYAPGLYPSGGFADQYPAQYPEAAVTAEQDQYPAGDDLFGPGPYPAARDGYPDPAGDAAGDGSSPPGQGQQTTTQAGFPAWQDPFPPARP